MLRIFHHRHIAHGNVAEDFIEAFFLGSISIPNAFDIHKLFIFFDK